MRHIHNNETGFTLVELLMALAVFSVVMLLCTVGVIEIGKIYYKGVSQASAQQTARSVAEQMARSLEFGSSTPLSGGPTTVADGNSGLTSQVQSRCIGNTRYTYVIDRQLSNAPSSDPSLKQIRHVLWKDTISNSTMCNPLNLTVASPSDANTAAGPGTVQQELMTPNTRLASFNISSVAAAGGWSIGLRVIYGDDDLIDRSDPSNITCKNNVSGSQFCGVAALNTTVTPRIL